MNPYTLDDGAITGHNRPFFNNRPLYGDHRSSVVLAGDRPHLRFANKPNVYGCMTLAVQRGAASLWLHDFAEVICRYRPGRMEWEVSDPRFPELTLLLEAIPLAGAEGFAVKARSPRALASDHLIWAFGGSVPVGDASAHFDPIVRTVIDAGKTQLSPVLSQCFRKEDCVDNHVSVVGDRLVLTTNGEVRHVAGRCTSGRIHLSDATAWQAPGNLFAHAPDKHPLACGLLALDSQEETYWAFEVIEAPGSPTPSCSAPGAAFSRAQARVDALAKRIELDTPDPRLDAGVAAASYAIDSTYYPPVYVHGAMAWNIPFPGWRSIYGATAFGWHENVKAEARYYIASQNRETARGEPNPNTNRRLCTQATDSRFHGRGRITQDDGPYNFQTQFFDQLIHAWRWTGDAELEDLLRDALELHLEWTRDCFDPDDDGLYESYINSWPTDSVWYNGGGSVEESSYAYAGHRAAAEMARRADDEVAARRHEAQAEKIRAALLDTLWIDRKGYMGQYKEQGGHQRVHEDSWLAAIFLPIETGLLDFACAAQSLYYTEWALQRVFLPFGGNRCWMSNWVPAPWSTRELHPGDDFALALAYFRAGIAEEGWDLLKGNYLACMYHGVVPGGLASAHCGTDFSDILSMFCRVVVEGLFGYQPDYPSHHVRIAPQIPASWEKGSIHTPDVSIAFRREGATQEWSVTLTRPAQMTLDLPVRATEISRVDVNGAPAKWNARAGFGCSIIRIEVSTCHKAIVRMRLTRTAAENHAISLTGDVGQPIRLTCDSGAITEFRDPQSVLTNAALTDGCVDAQIAGNAGHHSILATIACGELTQLRLFKIHVCDPDAEAAESARFMDRLPPAPTWTCVDMRSALNGDIRMIYKQEYLSPRPKTSSLRIGIDGYSPWTFAYWKTPVPEIDLSRVSDLLDDQSRLLTPSKVPFNWPGEERNIAFTSLWDNWPDAITVPIGQQGEAIYVLLCGSTNPMQCRIANARLRLSYADGEEQDLALIPPMNFWTLCPLGGADYDYTRDAFSLPPTPPPTVELGNNCRAVLLNLRMRPGVELTQICLETLSQDVVIGLMGVTILNAQ